jgi:hypothetical protein
MVRAKLRDAVVGKTALYYTYTVKDGQTAENVADKYYGSPNMVWVIYYANNIFDPIFDWHLEHTAFQKYLVEKYGSLSSIMTLYRTDGSLNLDSISHYVETDLSTGLKYIVDKKTYLQRKSQIEYYKAQLQNNAVDTSILRTLNPIEPVTIYEHEHALNEAKKDVVVIDKVNIGILMNEIRNVFD